MCTEWWSKAIIHGASTSKFLDVELSKSQKQIQKLPIGGGARNMKYKPPHMAAIVL